MNYIISTGKIIWINQVTIFHSLKYTGSIMF